MTRITLIADEEHVTGYRTWLQSLSTVELVELDADMILDLRFLDLSAEVSAAPIVITNLLTCSVTSRARHYAPQTKVIGASILPSYIDRQKMVEWALPIDAPKSNAALSSIFPTLGKEAELIGDAVGGIFARTVSMIINEAAFAVQENVATFADIDSAMRLGTNYPIGPLTFCDEIGASTVVAILEALSKEYGADRYRPAALLRRYAEANLRFYPKIHTS